MNSYRHGDLIFIPITKSQFEKIADMDSAKKNKDSAVLALGEATGHKHVIRVKKAKSLSIYKLDSKVDLRGISQTRDVFEGDTIVVIESEGEMDHEEHGKLDMEPGIYLQRVKQEYDPFENNWAVVYD